MRGLLVDFGGVLTTNVFDSFRSFGEAEGLDPQTVKRAFREDPQILHRAIESWLVAGAAEIVLVVPEDESELMRNLAGTAVILAFAFALIFRESAEVDRVTRACLDQGYTCWPVPSVTRMVWVWNPGSAART